MQKRRDQQESWQRALEILLQLRTANKKLGTYLQRLQDDSAARAYVLDVVKHRRCFDYFLQQRLKRSPKPMLQCFLQLVMGQLWQLFFQKNSKAPWAAQINGWVERAKIYFSPPECRCINAVLRQVYPYYQRLDALPWSIRYNAPEFLLERYRKIFGGAALLAFLQWNEQASTVYIRTVEVFEFLEPTAWPDFYTLKDPHRWSDVFALVAQGRAYIQDPMTRIPLQHLDISPGLDVLDLCAAPGGKTVQLAQKCGVSGHIFAVDLPHHLQRLRENLRAYPQVQVVAKDLLELTSEDIRGIMFDRILLDVPCSNTGVIRRKPDVIDRLRPQDFTLLPQQQFLFLQKACRFLKVQGLCVYSTCSIDPDENEGVVQRFLKINPNFRLKSEQISLPWRDHHDGGGCFCLQRTH